MEHKSKGKKASFGLITAPFLIFLGIAIVIPLTVYLYQDRFYLTSHHRDLLRASIHDKKTKIQSLLDEKVGILVTISKLPELRSSIEDLQTDTSNIKSRREARAAEDKRQEALNRSKTIIHTGTELGQFGRLLLISRDGKVLVSSSDEHAGVSIADTELFKDRISKATRPMIIGSWLEPKRGYEFHMVSPVFDRQGNLQAYLYGSMNLSTLATVLSEGIKGPIVFEIIDRHGKILSSTEEIGSRRYNPALITIDNQLHYYDGLFINMAPLSNTELILLQKAQSQPFIYPLTEAIVIYALLVLLVFIIILYQSIYLRRKVSAPLSKLLAAIRSTSAGLRPVLPQNRYPVEVDNLIKAVQNLITDFVLTKDKAPEIKDKDSEPNSSNNPTDEAHLAPIEAVPITQPTPKEAFKAIEPVGRRNSNPTMPIVSFLQESTDSLKASLLRSMVSTIDHSDLYKLRQDALTLSCLADNYAFISSYENKASSTEAQAFPIQEVFDALTVLLDSFKEFGNLEVIYEFDRSIGTSMVKVHKGLLLRVILNLIYNALASTNDGTITVLCTKDDSGGDTALIRFHISDTGSGYQKDEIGAIKAGVSTIAPALSLAFMLAGIVGLNLSIESIKGKGSIYTLIL